MIQINNLYKNYGELEALKNITLNIKKGSITGLLGPNGAGKTTLMRIITGYMTATSGDCFVDGLEIHQSPREVQSILGYLPENPPLYFEMTVKEYLTFVAQIKGVPKTQIKERIDKVVTSVVIQDRINQIIGTLSKGYKQRVGLAMALLNDPKLLILDEPTIGLDPNQIVEMRKIITDLSGQRTVILSSHILSEVASTCDNIIIINKGEVAVQNTKEQLLKGVSESETIIVKVTNDTQGAADLLKAELNLNQVDVSENVIQIKDPQLSEKLPKIARALITKDYDILELLSKHPTLEDIFHKLTLNN